MQNFKDVCGNKKTVWFEIELNEGKEFLQWAKDLGCIWTNGEEIEPDKEVEFFHFSIDSDGKLANVPISAWVSKQPDFKNIKRYIFADFISPITHNTKTLL